MLHASFDDLRTLSQQTLARGPLADAIRDVRIAAPDDPDDDSLVRIIITIAAADTLDLKQAAQALRELEHAIAQADDRVPSIRFAEAA